MLPLPKCLKKKTSKIDAEVYVSRNRNDCGTNEVQQNIKKGQKTKNLFNKYS